MKKLYSSFFLIFFIAVSITNAQNLIQTFIESNIKGTTDFGNSVASAGDVNGDGKSDIIVGALHYNSSIGRAYIYFGDSIMGNNPDVILNGSGSTDYFGCSVASAGDVNKDGFGDVIIGAYSTNGARGQAYIFFGGNKMDSIPDVILYEGINFNYFGFSVASAGDLNGDGFGDVIIGAYGNNSGKAFIYYGGFKMDSISDVTLYGEGTINVFGKTVASAGDFNGDGFGDVIVGHDEYNSYTGRAYIYFGSKNMDNAPDILFNGDTTYNYFGCSVASAGDINRDGYSDVIVGSEGNNSYKGCAKIFYGGKNLKNLPVLTLIGEKNSSAFGCSVASAGDINGDGNNDLVVGSRGYNNSIGRCYLFYGGNTMDTVPDLTIDGIDNFDHFGSSIGSTGDVNSDGYCDLIIGAYGSIESNPGKTFIYFGGKYMDNTPDVNLTGEGTGNYFGRCVASAGDVNGDGNNDVIVGADRYGYRVGAAYIYFGGRSFDKISDVRLTGVGMDNYFGESVASAGDVNGDGFGDVIVGAIGASYSNSGRAYVYFGGNNMDSIPDLILTGEKTGDFFGESVSSAGDINNDGYSDVIVGAKNFNSETGRAYIYFGGKSMDSIPDIKFTGETTYSQFGYSVSSAGDVNKDGFSDVIVGAPKYYSSTGRVYIFYGGNNMDNSPDVTIYGKDANSFFGNSVTSTGDLNNDGYSDIIVGAYNYNSGTGRAYIYYGGNSMDFTSDVILTGEKASNFFGISLASAGDINNDGYSDIVVGAEGFETFTGRVYFYFGGNNMDSTPDLILTGKETFNEFGCSVASAGDINRDGVNDIIIGAAQRTQNGEAYIYNFFISTLPVTDIKSDSAVGHGSILSIGTSNITAYGVCWNITGTPSISDSYTDLGNRNLTGDFNSLVTGLKPNTKYYLRTYITNSNGTYYGNEVNFITLKNTGVNFINIDRVSIFPNPSDRFLNISGLPAISIGKQIQLEIFDLMGHKLIQQYLNITQDLFSIDLRNLQKGIYIIKIQIDSQKLVYKFIKD